MSISLYSEGAVAEVTGSRHFVAVDGRRILVDCGAFQGRRKETDAKNRAPVRDPESLETVVLTHAHYDHCGLLPLLVKRGFSGDIIATPATRDLAQLVMADSARIQARDADYLARQAARRGERFDWVPLYDEGDVTRAVGHFVTLGYGRKRRIAEAAEIEFLDAGHILGSALVRMTVTARDGARAVIGFSGDLGRKDKPIIRDPEPLEGLDYLVLDSTYGNRLHEPAPESLARLAAIVRETALRGGKVVIPAFAVERTQELIFHLHLLQDRGEIPDIPVWVDSPMAVDATSIFKVHPECYDRETWDLFGKHSENPFGFAALHFSRTVEDSKRLNDAPGPMIIISADGMCEAGRIQHHLIHTIGDGRNTILIVGYMAEGTLGRRIRDGAANVRIHGDFYPVRARVEELAAFSAHADWAETVEWLRGSDISRIRRIFLVHGEPEALEGMRGHLRDSGAREVTIVERGAIYDLAWERS